ncbi:MAG: hypothetical protein IH626_22550 [Rhodospirillales bacterium]|nr:hypothetical protein [Rhodospirillales bacterium]
MPEALTIIFKVGMTVAFGVGLIAWFAGLLFALRMVHQARPRVGVWTSQMRWNPFKLLWMPSPLTDDGRSSRRKCLRAETIFAASVGLGLVSGLIADWR